MERLILAYLLMGLMVAAVAGFVAFKVLRSRQQLKPRFIKVGMGEGPKTTETTDQND